MGPHSSHFDPHFNARNDKTGHRSQSRGKDKSSSKTPAPTIDVPRKILSLDGRTLEGGGQLVRVALTLSALLAIPVHIHHIRGRRAGRGAVGGLKESHLAALNFLAEQCGAEVQGAWVGSGEVVVQPGREERADGVGNVEIALQKPGSVWLVWQALFPYLLFRGGRGVGPGEKVEVVLKGGTNVSNSMTGEYVHQVFLPICEKIGLPKVEVHVVQRGWAGNTPQIGEVRITLHPWPESRLPLDALLPGFIIQNSGALRKICITVVAHPRAFSTRLLNRVEVLLRSKIQDSTVQIETVVDEDSGDSRRLYLLLVAHTENGWRLGRDYLGGGKMMKNQKDVEQLVNEACERVVNELFRELETGGCVDRFLQDQLIIMQTLAGGRSVIDAGAGMAQGTLHTRTVRWVCQEMLKGQGLEFDVDRGCVGIAYGPDSRGKNDREINENDPLVEAVSQLNLDTQDK